MQEALMKREEREFLAGFERAARLVRQVLTCPQAYMSGDRYLEGVAQLHGDAEDLTCRGLAVGCLVALGRG
jgi:hypothetical protein